MHHLFGELRRLPCVYCTKRNCFASKCIKRGIETGDLEICEDMSPDLEVISLGITGYFEYLDAIKT